MSQNSNPLLPNLNIKDLENIKKNLLNKQNSLISELKSKHSRVYDWLVKNKINFNELYKYSKNIAAALALTNQLVTQTPPPEPAPTPTPASPPAQDNPSQTPNDPDLQAQAVWKNYGSIIRTAAKRYDIDPQLIFATIMTESEGNPHAYRYEPHLGEASYGLGQTLYSTAASLGFSGNAERLYDPEVSIDLIARYHKRTQENYGLLPPERMTVVYNTGQLFGYPYPGHLQRFRVWYYSYTDPEKKLT